MRVAIDATPLILSSGGLRRYTEELALALAVNFPQDDFLLTSDQPFLRPAPAPRNLRCCGGTRTGLERRWWLWGLEREMSRAGSDIFHGTNFAVPYLGRRPSVLTLHDLSPWKNAVWNHAADRVRKRTPFLIGLRLATLVITDTEAVRQEAIELFGAHPSRVLAIPLAASDRFRPAEAAAGERPYFLFVGTLEPRKNIPALIEAWRAVRGELDVELVLAGRAREDFLPVSQEPGLRILGEVRDEDLPGLYSAALAVVYPSHYEGFGLPVLEAMQCGAAVLVSRDAALREVAGVAAVEFSPAAMRAAALNPDWLGERRQASRRQAREFSWTRTARLTRAAYEEALRRQ